MTVKTFYSVLLVFLLVSCQNQQSTDNSQMVEYLGSDMNSPKPFCEAVRVGNLLILSGSLGRDPETRKLAPRGIKGETRQAMENIKSTLEKFGSSIDHVVKCTVMLADISEWEAMNEVYITYFNKHKPARSAFGTNGLAGDARVEIECWATLK